jgi:RNA polymerase sigma-70 factor, ECF subfamily
MPNTVKQLEFDKQLDLLEIRRFRRTGDLEILAGLYRKYMHLVYGVSLKYLKNRASAQDAVMQIFEKLTIEAIKQEITNFKGWLYVVTKNYCLMELRKRESDEENFRKWKEEEKRIMESGFEMHPIDNDTVLNDALLDCIKKLREQQKQCIELFYFKKKCYREIAEKLDVDENNVKSHIQNGKRNLKICLEGKHVG